jgi:hypothetical protein
MSVSRRSKLCFAVVSTTLAQFPLIATIVRQVFENINISHERGICCDSIIVFGKPSSFHHQRESSSWKSLSRWDGRIWCGGIIDFSTIFTNSYRWDGASLMSDSRWKKPFYVVVPSALVQFSSTVTSEMVVLWYRFLVGHSFPWC